MLLLTPACVNIISKIVELMYCTVKSFIKLFLKKCEQKLTMISVEMTPV